MPRSHPLLTRPHPVPLFLPLPRPPQESSSPSAAYVEGQYPFDPDMCDIYAMEMCMDGYDIDDSLGDAASSSFMRVFAARACWGAGRSLTGDRP